MPFGASYVACVAMFRGCAGADDRCPVVSIALFSEAVHHAGYPILLLCIQWLGLALPVPFRFVWSMALSM